MSRMRSQGKLRGNGPIRTSSGFSIRKENISAPIPQKTEEEEFPIRTPGAGIATPLGNESHDKQLRMREPAEEEVDGTSRQSGIAISDFVDPATSTQSRSIPSQTSHVTPPQKVDQASTLRASTASVTPSTSVEKKQHRKKSSFRSALGKLFGKKRKSSDSHTSQKIGSNDVRAEQHRSAPTALNRSPISHTSLQQRSASMPIDEYNRALRSHSVVLEDFPLRDDPFRPNRESIQADGFTRPRRATTPSRLWTPSRTPGFVDLNGLSPRPASTHVRGSQILSDEDAEAVGIAVTSGSHPNRRSRSLGELRSVMRLQASSRRRSDEIKYWRESYDLGMLSPMSSNKPDEEPEIVDVPDRAEEPKTPAQEAPQPFNFGLLGEMAGMKITQAASLETRVMQLEQRMLQLEHQSSDIHYNTGTEPLQFQDPAQLYLSRPDTERSDASLPKYRQHREGHATINNKRSSSYGSARPSTTSTNDSCHPSFDELPPPNLTHPETALSLSQHGGRPLSTSTTIRGIPSSSPTAAKEAVLTAEHYRALTNMVIAEQTARHNLEAVVHALQQELKLLRYSHKNGDTLNRHISHRGEFSTFERDESSDEEGPYANEDFRTPIEGGNFGDDIFGPSLNDHGEMKSEPRTLSLSQMTLGKVTQHSVQF